MTLFSPDNSPDQNELVGRLCNEDLDTDGQDRLFQLLSADLEAQRQYVRYVDLHVAMRDHARALDDEDFTVLEAQAALDAITAACGESADSDEHGGTATNYTQRKVEPSTPAAIRCVTRWERLRALAQGPVAWAASAAVLFVGFLFASLGRPVDNPQQVPPPSKPLATSPPLDLGPAWLRGTVGARWAGARIELPEGERFVVGQRLELVEGLAEVRFGDGASVVLQGPAIFQIRSSDSASLNVGRLAANVPPAAKGFNVHTSVADLTSHGTEFGAEVDVDGSLVTQVYKGDVEMQLNRGSTPVASLQMAGGQGARVASSTGQAVMLEQPNELHFVRYLPIRATLINLADVVAGGDGISSTPSIAHHRGISLNDGKAVDDYGAPAAGDGRYIPTQGLEFVDGVFIPNGELGPVQVDSIGRRFADFPSTTGDCWGGAIMARRPKEEQSLPLIRLEFYGETYGYVNWLHIASKPDELSPEGRGLIGMHSNSCITFDLHAIRARHPNKKILRFQALVGNLESKPESGLEKHVADAWVIIDGQLRHCRKNFSREDGPETIDVPLADRDRFLVLAVTDAGGDTAYDWIAFGDAIIEMTNLEGITSDVDYSHQSSQFMNQDEPIRSGLLGRTADQHSFLDATAPAPIEPLGGDVAVRVDDDQHFGGRRTLSATNDRKALFAAAAPQDTRLHFSNMPERTWPPTTP